MNTSKVKEYLITIIIQILILTIFIIVNYFAMKLEVVVLEPIKYILPFGIALLCIDVICIFIVFRKAFRKETNEVDA